MNLTLLFAELWKGYSQPNPNLDEYYNKKKSRFNSSRITYTFPNNCSN